jgi:hypothetical protein
VDVTDSDKHCSLLGYESTIIKFNNLAHKRALVVPIIYQTRYIRTAVVH